MDKLIGEALKARLKQIDWKRCAKVFIGAFLAAAGATLTDGKDVWVALGVGVSAGAYATYAFVLNPTKQAKPENPESKDVDA